MTNPVEPQGDVWERAKRETNWFVYRIDPPKPDGKRPKIPCNPETGRNRKTTTAARLTFDEAANACTRLLERFGETDDFCIGYLPRPGSALIILDWDGCVSEDGTLAHWVKPIVSESYTELSVSGTGLHTLTERQPDDPTYIRERNGAGIYSSDGRGIALTFDKIKGSPVTVNGAKNARITAFDRIGRDEDWQEGSEGVSDWSHAVVDDVRTALERIDPSSDREQWLRVVFALHNWFDGGQDGYELAEEWSRGDFHFETPHNYEPDAVADVWKGAKGEGVGVGTIFFLAGWGPENEVTADELDTAFEGMQSEETDEDTGVHQRRDATPEELAEVKTSTKAAMKVFSGFNHTIGEILGDPDRDYATELLNKAAVVKACRLVAWNAVHNKFTCFARNSDPGWVIEEKRAHAQIPERLRRSGVHLFKEGARERLMGLVDEAITRMGNGITAAVADRMHNIASQAAVAGILDYAAANRRFINLTQRETLRPQTAIGLDVYFDPRKSVMTVRTKLKFPDINKYAKWANDAVWDDYREHFPELEDLLRFIVAIRVNENGKRGFVFLQASSDFGKSELIKIIKTLGICTEIDQAEMDRLTKGQPSGLSPSDFVTSWVLALDEFRSMNDQAKQWSDDISVNVKYGSNNNAPVYTKLFTSADPIASFDDPSEQLLNRFSYINRTSSGSIKHRPVFQKVGEEAYRLALFYHIGRLLNAEMQQYVSMPENVASKKSYEVIETFRAEYPLTGVEDAIENRIDELAYDWTHWMGRRNDDVLSNDRLDKFVREHTHTLFDKDGNPMEVDGSIVVGVSYPRELFKRFLHSVEPSKAGRLVLHYDAVAKHLNASTHVRPWCRKDSPNAPYKQERMLLIKAEEYPEFARMVGVNTSDDIIV